MIVAALLASLALQQSPAPQSGADCLDDNLADRCTPDARAGVRAALGMKAIEEEAATGAEVYRAFFVDGYGRDMPAIAFERRPGRSPQVVVYAPDGRVMSADVSSQTWERVRTESVFADRQLAAPISGAVESGTPPPPPLCLHSWVQTVEMANTTPERYRVVPVRRRTEDACGGALTTRFAFFLATMAVEALPPCDALDEARQRNHVTLLATCAGLRGDRLAAAELRNARERVGPRWGLDQKDPGAWRAALGTNGSPVLDWGGTVVRTDRSRNNAVAEFIVARLAELPGLSFQQLEFEGLDARSAAVTGQARYGDESSGRFVADYRQRWVWDPNLHDWMLAEWTVEPFRPAT
jgi:hypothetical protein